EGDGTMRGQTKWTVWLGAWLCAASVLTAGFCEAQEAGRSPSDARALLLGMGEFLGKTQQLSVTVRAAYDTVQASGQKVEWNEVRTLTLSRPDRLRVESERSNGTRSVVVFDGEEPLPQRIVLTYPAAPGQPQFRAEFSAWNLAPQPADALFTFTPPAAASKIPFAAALPRYAPGPAGAPAKKGATR